MYTDTDHVTTLEPTSSESFTETLFIKKLINRAFIYLNAGFPIHFRGISGVGKTALALRIAEMLGRPVMLIHGDDQIGTSDLMGGEFGYKSKKLHDNFIHSVFKIEESVDKSWVDRHLLVAIENGFTLIYDEFTRSRPEANNILLPILQEGFISPPPGRDGKLEYLHVHPNFRAILTSNPEEYAGVHRSQDALRDRLITMDLQEFDEETEVEIVAGKSHLPKADVIKIVKFVRDLRKYGKCEFIPTVRAPIMIAKCIATMKKDNVFVNFNDKIFRSICFDILSSETSRNGSITNRERVQEVVSKSIDKYCSSGDVKNFNIKTENIPVKKKLKEVLNANAKSSFNPKGF